MSHPKPIYSVAQLLDELESKGFAMDEGVSSFVVDRLPEKELPLYIRILAGFGATIASFFFVGFLWLVGLIDISNEKSLILVGILFVAGAVALQRATGHKHTVRRSFFIQSSFASMGIGKILFVLGLQQLMNTEWGATVGLLVITCVTYPIYRMSIDRFLSSFGVLLSILINLSLDHDVLGVWELLFYGFFFAQFICAAVLVTSGKIKREYIPLSYAFILSLCTSVLLSASGIRFGFFAETALKYPFIINIVLTGGLIALFAWVAGGFNKLKSQPLVLASIGTVLLGSITAPGILLAIGLMVLGYAKHETILSIIGILLMPLFLGLYYYNLDISLLQKSFVLVGSGIILLAGRVYLKRKGWDNGGASCVQNS